MFLAPGKAPSNHHVFTTNPPHNYHPKTTFSTLVFLKNPNKNALTAMPFFFPKNQGFF
jgi:hypothetical protein